MLFRGVVHECDKMVRVRNNDVPNATKEELELLQERVKLCPVLPFNFYLTYANALYNLSLVEEENAHLTNSSSIAFLNEALYKAETALDLMDCVESHYVIGRILLQMVLKVSHHRLLLKESAM
jgi:hypothetical protein